ncbi:aminoglycoside phosphotransferase family protein [Antarctobacter jejuensis]|uniref:aminoglycoside phosphotransferase family protein n=1 Tax=Antarctobacter jejuensis TaxID=1439938 RepID=UPI003FD0D87B
MTPAEAEARAVEALRRHWDGALPEALSGGGGDAFLFSAKGPCGAVVVKVWTDGARAQRQARQQRQAARAMSQGRFRVPRIRFVDQELQALGMVRVNGRSLAALWPEGSAGLAEAAGGWLAVFHGLTRRDCVFDPTGQVNWLDRLMAEGAAGGRPIADFTGFQAAAVSARDMAPALNGLPSTRAVTHRDMTLSNLMLSGDDRVWGIDFENRREDEPLRDLFTLALDVLTLGGDEEQVAALVAGYGDANTDPQVRLFLQRCFCLWVQANTPPAPSTRQALRLKVAQRLLASDRPFI